MSDFSPEPTEQRAFLFFNTIPPGHTTYRQVDTRHEPHIFAGEVVLVDATDRAIQFGELYLVDQSNGPIIWQVNPRRLRVPGKYPVVNLDPLNRPKRKPNGETDLSQPVHTSDGPLYRLFLVEQIIGRVVGILQRRPVMSAQEVERRLADHYASLPVPDAVSQASLGKEA